MKNISIAIASIIVLFTITVSHAQDEKSITDIQAQENKPASESPVQEKKPATASLVQEKKCITDTGDLALTVGDFLAFRSYSGDLYEDYNQDFSFNPSLKMSLEVFLYKGLALGGAINFEFKDYTGYLRETFSSHDETKVNDIFLQLGPSLYYYLNFFNKYIPYIGFSFMYSQQGIEAKHRYDDQVILSYTMNYFDCSPSIGFMYVVNTYFGIFINYTFTARMRLMDEGKVSGALSDEILVFLETNKENRWGYIHTLSIGFKVFFDIR